MGVKSLWSLLTPVGRPVLLENMEGKAMAIDSSIWIYQFQATMRDKDGRALHHAHLLGFLRRIAKLLFYGIKPVFVFDGGAPVLKRLTINDRRKKKAGAAASHAKIAEKLLAAHMRREALNHAKSPAKKATRDKGKSKAITTGEEEELPFDAVYLEDIDPNTASAPNSPKPIIPEEQPPSTESSPSKDKNPKFYDHDSYRLPPIDYETVIQNATASSAPDSRLATQDELHAFINEMRPGDFDVSSPAFRELPVEVQYEIIGDLWHKSRQTSYDRLEKMLKNAETPLDFSKQQIKYLKRRNALTQQMWSTTDSSRSLPVRIANERNREYVLEKNTGVDGGWILGIKDDGTREKPIEIDQDAVKVEEKEEQQEVNSDEEMEQAYIPTQEPFDADLREYRREQALSMRYSTTTTTNKKSTSTKVPLNPLFVPDIYDSDEDNESMAMHFITQDLADQDEDEQIAQAIEQSLVDSQRMPPPMNAFASSSKAGPLRVPNAYTATSISVPTASYRLGTAVSIANTSPKKPSVTKSAPEIVSMLEEDDSDDDMDMEEVQIDDGKQKQPEIVIEMAQPEVPIQDMIIRDGSATLEFSSQPSMLMATSSQIATDEPQVAIQDTSIQDGSAKPTLEFSSMPSMLIHHSSKEVAEKLDSTLEFSMPPAILMDTSSKEVVEKSDSLQDNVEMRLLSNSLLQSRERSDSFVAETVDDSMVVEAGSVTQALITSTAEKFSMDFVSNDLLKSQQGPNSPLAEPVEEVDVEPASKTSTTRNTIPPPHNFSNQTIPSFSRSPSPLSQADFTDEDRAPSPPTEDWDAAQEMDATVEEGEFARFMSQVRNKDIADVRKEIDDEINTLNQQKKVAMRDSDEISQQMVSQIMMMLRLFGIPYITAPMEAEAQCAELVSLGLVDGVITDDSDVFLFGAQRVFKNMFNQSKTVECFFGTDLSRELGLDRDTLIRLAYLLGSDYVDGLPGVGPVVAMELLKEFPGEDGLHKFKEWWLKVQSGKDQAEDTHTKFRKSFKKKFKSLYLSTEWPNAAVKDAYYHPAVDSSDEPFKWGLPDLDALRHFLREELSWPKHKVDELLLPIIQKMGKRGQANAANKQDNLNAYFDITPGGGNYAPRKRQAYTSKRLQQVVTEFRKGQNTSQTEESSEEEGPPKKKSRVTKSKDKAAKSKSQSPVRTTSQGRGTGRGGATAAKRTRKKKVVSSESQGDSEVGDNDTFVGKNASEESPPPTERQLRPRPKPRPLKKS